MKQKNFFILQKPKDHYRSEELLSNESYGDFEGFGVSVGIEPAHADLKHSNL